MREAGETSTLLFFNKLFLTETKQDSYDDVTGMSYSLNHQSKRKE
jgi:hypothetical protein